MNVLGHPEIVCDYGVVRFKVSTTKGHASSVFVRGQADKSECTFHNTGNVTIELAKCNVRRKREINPSGVAYQMTVVVQLHPVREKLSPLTIHICVLIDPTHSPPSSSSPKWTGPTTSIVSTWRGGRT